VPIADAQKIMGHESPQTLLGIYAHAQNGARDRIIGALAAFSLPSESDPGQMRLSPSADRGVMEEAKTVELGLLEKAPNLETRGGIAQRAFSPRFAGYLTKQSGYLQGVPERSTA
jgi:hypothetical protein